MHPTDKCFFHVQTVEYLGYILSLSELTMAADKKQVIQDWPEPWKIKDIQSFLGFANFYRHLIPHYSDIAVPLTRLTHKGSAWDFSDKCCSTFNTLKKAFTTAPVLTHWIPGSPLIIEMDASDDALAAILSMVSPMDNEVLRVSYWGHKILKSTSVDCNKINIVTVKVRIMWESPGNSHAIAIQWVLMVKDPPAPILPVHT